MPNKTKPHSQKTSADAHKTHTKKVGKKSTVKRLLIANLVAALFLLTVVTVTLFATGLLQSIFAFIF